MNLESQFFKKAKYQLCSCIREAKRLYGFHDSSDSQFRCGKVCNTSLSSNRAKEPQPQNPFQTWWTCCSLHSVRTTPLVMQSGSAFTPT